MLPTITALKLNDNQWRAASLNNDVARTELAAFGFSFSRELRDGTAIYLGTPAAGGRPQNEDAAIVFDDLSMAAANCMRPTANVQLMAIVNLTADSFSDGGTYQVDDGALLAHCQKLVADGAALLDLGAESTRPGAIYVDEQTQLALLKNALNVIKDLDVPLSIDTRSSLVAEACLDSGAKMINDVSAFGDRQMAKVVAKFGAKVVLMHSRGTSQTMQQMCNYDHLLGNICDELALSINHGLSCGIPPDCIIIDPGIGFAKTASQNFEIIKNLSAFRSLGFSVLAGPSRKSFIASVLPQLAADERDGATIGAASVCAFNGAEYLRLHCGGTNWDAVKIAQACS